MNETDGKTLTEIFARHGAAKDELITVMQDAQEKFGYLPPDVMERIASHFRLAPGIVYGVATFYSLFKLEPSGKNIVRVCRGTACHVRGAERILREVEVRLGLKPGETSHDMEYTLETVACIGACALAPNITVNRDVHGQLTPKKVGEFITNRASAK